VSPLAPSVALMRMFGGGPTLVIVPPAVAAVLKSVTLEQARHIANKALEQISSAEAKAAAREELPILDELGL